MPPPVRAAGLAILALAALAGVTGTGGAAAAQTVSVVVTDADADEPVPRALVTLMTVAGGAVDSATTDAAGRAAVEAPSPGTYYVEVVPPGYLGMTEAVEVVDRPVETRVRIPLRSIAAAGIMRETISREAAFQLPLPELCGEALRPWEAGVLVGVARDRSTMDPLPGALVRLLGDPTGVRTGGDATAPAPARTATASGAFWFCNVPPGPTRVVAVADGFRPDTFTAVIQAGSIAWYDALLRRRGGER